MEIIEFLRISEVQIKITKVDDYKICQIIVIGTKISNWSTFGFLYLYLKSWWVWLYCKYSAADKIRKCSRLFFSLYFQTLFSSPSLPSSWVPIADKSVSLLTSFIIPKSDTKRISKHERALENIGLRNPLTMTFVRGQQANTENRGAKSKRAKHAWPVFKVISTGPRETRAPVRRRPSPHAILICKPPSPCLSADMHANVRTSRSSLSSNHVWNACNGPP